MLVIFIELIMEKSQGENEVWKNLLELDFADGMTVHPLWYFIFHGVGFG